MVACAGLTLVGDRLNPGKSTADGVGVLMLEAAKCAAKKRLELGEAGASGGGTGAATTLGIAFWTKRKKCSLPPAIPCARLRGSTAPSVFCHCSNREHCHVYCEQSALQAKRGGAYLRFAKGASPDIAQLLNQGLAHMASVLQRNLGVFIADISGAGAADNMGAVWLVF